MTPTNKKGFTIIEVVLVLAIAGLIFAMVFIAWPALQRGQRDTARKSDASTVASALGAYKSSNKQLPTPTDVAKFRKYLPEKLDQYNNNDVDLKNSGSVSFSGNEAKIIAYIGKKCPAEAPAPGDLTVDPAAGTSRTAAVFVLLENNGTNHQIYCVEA